MTPYIRSASTLLERMDREARYWHHIATAGARDRKRTHAVARRDATDLDIAHLRVELAR